jgi:hypothetical protein
MELEIKWDGDHLEDIKSSLYLIKYKTLGGNEGMHYTELSSQLYVPLEERGHNTH